MSRAVRRPRNFNDHPGNPHPSVVSCEWSMEELAERYVAQRRVLLMARRQAAAEGKGDGEQSAAPSQHAEDDNQAPQRRGPGVR